MFDLALLGSRQEIERHLIKSYWIFYLLSTSFYVAFLKIEEFPDFITFVSLFDSALCKVGTLKPFNDSIYDFCGVEAFLMRLSDNFWRLLAKSFILKFYKVKNGYKLMRSNLFIEELSILIRWLNNDFK